METVQKPLIKALKIIAVIAAWFLVGFLIVHNPYKEGTGHYAGYEWARGCHGNSDSFIEGCENWKKRWSLLNILVFGAPVGFFLGFLYAYSKRDNWHREDEMRRHEEKRGEDYERHNQKKFDHAHRQGKPTKNAGKSATALMKKKSLTIAGVEIGPETMPHLYRIAETNPEGLAEQLASLAKASGGTVEGAAQNLESDLQHG